MTRIEQALRESVRDLSEERARFALVGGLAVSAWVEPRFTRDVDLAVAVGSDQDAEHLVARLQVGGYRVLAQVEQTATARLATVRLIPRGQSEQGVVVDLLFASSGIEFEIVERAPVVSILSHLRLPVARLEHLIALKVLARDDRNRPQDRVDALAMLRAATESQVAAAREALILIEKRGFHRDKNLLRELDELILECGAR